MSSDESDEEAVTTNISEDYVLSVLHHFKEKPVQVVHRFNDKTGFHECALKITIWNDEYENRINDSEQDILTFKLNNDQFEEICGIDLNLYEAIEEKKLMMPKGKYKKKVTKMDLYEVLKEICHLNHFLTPTIELFNLLYVPESYKRFYEDDRSMMVNDRSTIKKYSKSVIRTFKEVLRHADDDSVEMKINHDENDDLSEEEKGEEEAEEPDEEIKSDVTTEPEEEDPETEHEHEHEHEHDHENEHENEHEHVLEFDRENCNIYNHDESQWFDEYEITDEGFSEEFSPKFRKFKRNGDYFKNNSHLRKTSYTKSNRSMKETRNNYDYIPEEEEYHNEIYSKFNNTMKVDRHALIRRQYNAYKRQVTHGNGYIPCKPRFDNKSTVNDPLASLKVTAICRFENFTSYGTCFKIKDAKQIAASKMLNKIFANKADKITTLGPLAWKAIMACNKVTQLFNDDDLKDLYQQSLEKYGRPKKKPKAARSSCKGLFWKSNHSMLAPHTMRRYLRRCKPSKKRSIIQREILDGDYIYNRHHFISSLPKELKDEAWKIILSKKYQSSQTKAFGIFDALGLRPILHSETSNGMNSLISIDASFDDFDCFFMGHPDEVYDEIVDYFKCMLK